jgi:hypothetical protein
MICAQPNTFGVFCACCAYLLWMNASCYRRMSVCLSVCMYVTKCIVTKLNYATNILSGPNIPLDNRNRSVKRRRKKSAIMAAGRHLEFLKTNIWKCSNFEPFDISTPPHHQTGVILLRTEFYWILATFGSCHPLCSHPQNDRMLKHNKYHNFRTVWPIYAKPASFCSGCDCH